MSIDKRVTDLEIKFSHQDELLNELNIIVANQQVAIESLQRVVKDLMEKSQASGEKRTLVDDKPPHY